MKKPMTAVILLLALTMHLPALSGEAEEEAKPSPPEAGTSLESDTKAKKKGHWLGFPIPITNPVLGYGLVGGVLYNRKLGRSQKESNFGAAAFYTSSKSWGVGIGARTHLNRDRLRVNGVFGYADLNWEFFGVGKDAGDNNRSIELNQAGEFLQTEVLFRIHEDLYLGPRFTYLNVDTILNLGLPPGFPDPDIDAVTSSLGAHLEWDSRDNEFSATRGNLLDFFGDAYSEAWGSDFTFQNYFFGYNHYQSLKKNTRHILAARATSCYSTDGAPFYEQCSIGIKDNFRGYTGMRYIDQFSITAQAEYRWEFVKRWSFVFFGGLAEVAPDPGDLSYDSILPGIGTGVRYMIKQKERIGMRLDFAWGEGDQTIYLGIGEAF
jgi:outer membrane protein assembly factor BamA